MTTIYKCAVMALCSLSCCLNEPMEASDEESSDSGEGDDTFSTISASASASSTSAATSADDDGSSSEESGTDGSTGEPTTDWALQFDGDTVAIKDNNGGAYGWTYPAWTVEAWIEIVDEDATGIIFDSEDPSLLAGWVLYLHSDYHALTFSFFDAGHQNNVVVGPSVADIGVGWHHIAATNSGEGTVYLHVDGVAATAQEVSTTISEDPPIVLWQIGGNVTNNPDFNLRGVVLDDLRISDQALYSGSFDPSMVLEASESTLLLLHFDEGEGVITEDTEASQMGFAIENPKWVPGYGQ
jgi:hypothetical protein